MHFFANTATGISGNPIYRLSPGQISELVLDSFAPESPMPIRDI